MFDKVLNQLQQQAEILHHACIMAKPYSHLVIDNLFAPELIEH